MTMGKEVATRTKAEIVLTDHADEFKRVLAKQINPDRFMRVMIGAVRANPALAKCDQITVLGALMASAQLSLEPNTPLGLAYLVPYKDKCQLIIGYKGLIDLAYRSGRVQQITAHVVYEKDDFEIEYGAEETIRHRPALVSDRGKRIGAYAVVKLKDGGVIQRFLPADEIEKARPAYLRDGAWFGTVPGSKTPNEYIIDEMWIKTALRRTLKTAPLSPELNQGIVADEASQRGAAWIYQDGGAVDLIDCHERPNIKPAVEMPKEKTTNAEDLSSHPDADLWESSETTPEAE